MTMDQVPDRAGGTIQTVVERSFLAPYGLEIGDERSHLPALLAIATFGASAREAIAKAAANGDPDIFPDIFTEAGRFPAPAPAITFASRDPRHGAGFPRGGPGLNGRG